MTPSFPGEPSPSRSRRRRALSTSLTGERENYNAKLEAFRLSTGSPIASFEPPDFRSGWAITSVLYAAGKVIVSGGPPVGAGTTLGAYHPVSGTPFWQQDVAFVPDSVVTDGVRLYTGMPRGTPGYKPIAAYGVTNGERVAGWGASLTRAPAQVAMFGVDATRVYCTSGPRAHHRIVALRSNGSLTKLRDRPARAVPHRGTKKTIVGVIRDVGSS